MTWPRCPKIGVQLSKLTELFSEKLKANAARIRGLSFLVHALLIHRTVNLVILSTSDDGRGVTNETRYRRLQDFFLNATLCYKSIGQFILSLISKPKKGYVLAMDRTNWKFGRKHINFLVLSIIAGKVSIPLVWKVLPQKTKRGNSDTAQRIALINRLLCIVPASDIEVLTMDREFVGEKWFKYLDSKGIGFIARIKMNCQISGQRADHLAATLFRRHLADAGRHKVFGLDLFFACKKMQDARADYLLLLSNRCRGQQALQTYRKRWGIERLFWHMKRKGFDLEATHITSAKKLDKLFAIVSLAFLICFAWGCRIRFYKQHSSQQSQRKSLFRSGLEDILRMMQQRYSEHSKTRQDLRCQIEAFEEWITRDAFAEIFLV